MVRWARQAYLLRAAEAALLFQPEGYLSQLGRIAIPSSQMKNGASRPTRAILLKLVQLAKGASCPVLRYHPVLGDSASDYYASTVG